MFVASLSPSQVRVLFTQPLYRSMKPCPFFMDGSCKFTDEACKYSHGSVVPVSQLEAYHDHDFKWVPCPLDHSGPNVLPCTFWISLAHVGGKCLAKYSDDLWHPAVIRSVVVTLHSVIHFIFSRVVAVFLCNHALLLLGLWVSSSLYTILTSTYKLR